jgi:flagellum-specific peptidoglycan hydrolase FlgJ
MMIKHIKLAGISLIMLSLVACGGSKKASQKQKPVYQGQTSGRVLSQSERDLERNTPVIDPGEDDFKNPPKANFSSNTARYIYTYKDIAKQEMRMYGIPASITMAQGILESGSGVGPLTSRSNNHFGIKCNGWRGQKVYHDDDRAQECFRKYTNPKYSFRDHSLFLKNRSRYAGLFRLDADDYKGWAHGLKAAGYATDPRYPRKLISLIKRYDLHKYDEEVLNTGEINQIAQEQQKNQRKNQNRSLTYTVKKGDTLYSISKRHDLKVSQLKRLNNLRGNNISVGQKLKIKSN